MASQAFPQPHRLSSATTRWRLSELTAYEARVADTDHVPETVEQERFLTCAQVAKRYGVSVATIWRWAAAGREAAA